MVYKIYFLPGTTRQALANVDHMAALLQQNVDKIVHGPSRCAHANIELRVLASFTVGSSGNGGYECRMQSTLLR